jgi:hypothetical protein
MVSNHALFENHIGAARCPNWEDGWPHVVGFVPNMERLTIAGGAADGEIPEQKTEKS